MNLQETKVEILSIKRIISIHITDNLHASRIHASLPPCWPMPCPTVQLYSTRQVLWRIHNGEVEGLNPKLVVLKIGTNNLYGDFNYGDFNYGDFNAGPDEEIAQGITTVVREL